MTLPSSFRQSPWDAAVFSMPAYEITEYSRAVLELAACTPGHYTIRVDPLAPKQLLQEMGFYYCDTLLEPHCTQRGFQAFDCDGVNISRDTVLKSLLVICHGAFSHGRFHRDFNLASGAADLRYDRWLTQLHAAGQVYGLQYHGELVGFLAANGNRLVLHAVAESVRGKGLAKYLWTPVCQALFAQHHPVLTSSVSASNLAVVNLYSALGFRFRNPVDLYHRLTP